MWHFALRLSLAVASSALFAGAAPSAERTGAAGGLPEDGTSLGSAVGAHFRLSEGALLPGKAISLESTAGAGSLRAPGIGIATHSQSASGAIQLNGAVVQDLLVRSVPEARMLPSLAAGVSLLWALHACRRRRS